MEDSEYVQRLVAISDKRSRKILQVVNPYRYNLRKWVRGNTLEIGCGIGRNLTYLNNPENIGLDVNHSAIEHCRSIGHNVYTNSEFAGSKHSRTKFDNILISHVLEHMTSDQAVDLIINYLPSLKSDGQIIIVCPQARGFKSDPTHVEFMNLKALAKIIARCDLTLQKSFSHPFPRIFSHIFIYNEYVVIASKHHLK